MCQLNMNSGTPVASLSPKAVYLFGKDIDILQVLDDICFVMGMIPYKQVLPKMTDEDAEETIRLVRKFQSIDRTANHEDGPIQSIAVCGEIDRLFKEIIAR